MAFQIEASIEAILDFGEIAMGVFDEIERVIGAGQRRLQIAQEGVDGTKLRQLRTGGTAASDGTFVGI